MAIEIPIADWPTFSVRLHPKLVAFLEGRARKSGRRLESEVSCVVGEAMEAAEIPPAPTSTKFQCSEDLIAEKAECKDCGDLIGLASRFVRPSTLGRTHAELARFGGTAGAAVA